MIPLVIFIFLVASFGFDHSLAFVPQSQQVAQVRNNKVLAAKERHRTILAKLKFRNHASILASDKNGILFSQKQERKRFLESIMVILNSGGLMISPSVSVATTINDDITNVEPDITSKVKFNVRISRPDGTFYTRDDETDKEVFYGSILLGLYGKIAPNHVERFLSFVQTAYSPLDDAPFPSYSRSIFPTFDQSNGLLTSGFIPGLQLSSFAGASALEYRGRILPATLWIEKNKSSNTTKFGQSRIPHSRAGLLTHRDLDVLPTFGITTREANVLNNSHTVFGTVIDTDSSKEFFSRCIDLPTYSIDRPAIRDESLGIGESSSNSSSSSRAAEELASSIYSLQKDFFRSAAKSLGDTRIDNVYEGKILRRVEVVSVEMVQ